MTLLRLRRQIRVMLFNLVIDVYLILFLVGTGFVFSSCSVQTGVTERPLHSHVYVSVSCLVFCPPQYSPDEPPPPPQTGSVSKVYWANVQIVHTRHCSTFPAICSFICWLKMHCTDSITIQFVPVNTSVREELKWWHDQSVLDLFSFLASNPPDVLLFECSLQCWSLWHLVSMSDWCEDPGSNLTMDGCVYRNSHWYMQHWAWGCCTFTAVCRLTQPSTLCGIVITGWVIITNGNG